MRKLDLYWKSNREWWEYKNHIPTIKESAPEKAKESYKRYLEQIKDTKAL
jgi:hypothetical protein